MSRIIPGRSLSSYRKFGIDKLGLEGLLLARTDVATVPTDGIMDEIPEPKPKESFIEPGT
jgi:hypothetical protein